MPRPTGGCPIYGYPTHRGRRGAACCARLVVAQCKGDATPARARHASPLRPPITSLCFIRRTMLHCGYKGYNTHVISNYKYAATRTNKALPGPPGPPYFGPVLAYLRDPLAFTINNYRRYGEVI